MYKTITGLNGKEYGAFKDASDAHEASIKDSKHRRNKKIIKAVGVTGMVGVTFVGISPQIESAARVGSEVRHSIVNYLEKSDKANKFLEALKQPGLANNPEAYAKLLIDFNKTDKDFTLETVGENVFTPYQAAKSWDAKDVSKVVEIEIAQLSDENTKVLGDIQGRQVIVPNEFLNQAKE